MSKYYTEEAIEKIKTSEKKLAHIVLIATKPDIIKQAPIYLELKKRGELVLLVHTGQHYDYRYSGGMEEEFGMEVDARLAIDGSLTDKVAQMIERFSEILQYLKENHKTPIPYIHGDTSTAMAIGVSSYLNGVSCAHVEAGIRTLTPKSELYQAYYNDFKNGKFDWQDYYEALQNRNNLELGSMEPNPEQFNTRIAEPSSGYHAAPVELVREFLLSEGYDSNSIDVVGNTVSDSTQIAIEEADKSTILDKYPQLDSNEFIRICIHRRENTTNAKRFTILFEAIEKLVRGGYSVLFISLFGTEEAIDTLHLRDRLQALVDEYPETFIYSDVWPYYRDVIAAMQKCSAVATDSGSMQEEMNILGIPCVTLRFGTDRGETILAGCNIQAPPIDSDFVVEIIKGALHNKQMMDVGNIYGSDVSRKLVDGVLARATESAGLSTSEEVRLGL